MLNEFQSKMLRELVIRSTTSGATADAMNSAIRALRPEYDQCVKDVDEVKARIADRERIISNLRDSDAGTRESELKIIGDSKARLQQLQAKIAEMDQQFAELQRRRGDTETQHAVYRRVADALLKFKGDTAAIAWDEAAGAGKTLEEIRAEISAIGELIRKTERAPLSAEDIRQRALDWIKSIIRVENADKLLDYLSSYKRPTIYNPDTGSDALAYIFFILGPDAVADMLTQRLTADGRSVGLSAGPRAAKIEELRQQMLELEIAEEHLILDNEAHGIATLRRVDVSPESLLVAWRDYEQAAEATA